jgi:hypothetical protein
MSAINKTAAPSLAPADFVRPAFVKIGRLVKCRPYDLCEWLQSFQTVRSTFEVGEGR